jgi:AraC-like DNA-binding protein
MLDAQGIFMEICTVENFISKELSFHIFQESRDCSVSNPYFHQTHSHEFAEIVYMLSGTCTHTINDIPYTARRGDMFFMNSQCIHSYASSQSYKMIVLCFSPEALLKRITDKKNVSYFLSLSFLTEIQSDLTPIGKFSFMGEERAWIEHLLKATLAEYKAEEPERLAVLESYMTILIVNILRKVHSQSLANNKELSDVWNALSEFIDENLNQKLSLEDLAQKCFYNPSYFSRAFKQKFGCSPVEYIARERSHKAADLLSTNPHLTMEKISEECGFGDKSSLYRSFEKFYGCSPSEYKKSILKK